MNVPEVPAVHFIDDLPYEIDDGKVFLICSSCPDHPLGLDLCLLFGKRVHQALMACTASFV